MKFDAKNFLENENVRKTIFDKTSSHVCRKFSQKTNIFEISRKCAYFLFIFAFREKETLEFICQYLKPGPPPRIRSREPIKKYFV
jgi:hypothetical protein